MIRYIFATKKKMSQAWLNNGKRIPVTKCVVGENIVVNSVYSEATENVNNIVNRKKSVLLQIGYGIKKLKNTKKPLRVILEKLGLKNGVKHIFGIHVFGKDEDELKQIKDKYKPGTVLDYTQIIKVGDIVNVQGKSKGKGFTGVVKRHGFKTGPRTHGQSDRLRAPGSIGAQTPGRVWKGKRMAGHSGDETVTIKGLKVVYIDRDNNEIWLSGPIPGYFGSVVKIINTGKSVSVDLDKKASGIVEKVETKEDKKTVDEGKSKQEKQDKEKQAKQEIKK